MLEFKLSKAQATLENFNPRMEKHGPDKVPAADLHISASLSADFLTVFSPVLPKLLWDDSAPKDLAEGMPLRDPHQVYPLGRDEEMTGATVEIDFGIGEPMVFADAKVNQFKITPWPGGQAIIGWRVQCLPDGIEEFGRLCILQGRAITVTVNPPELPEMQQQEAA
jgi:hypothetical protein